MTVLPGPRNHCYHLKSKMHNQQQFPLSCLHKSEQTVTSLVVAVVSRVAAILNRLYVFPSDYLGGGRDKKKKSSYIFNDALLSSYCSYWATFNST